MNIHLYVSVQNCFFVQLFLFNNFNKQSMLKLSFHRKYPYFVSISHLSLYSPFIQHQINYYTKSIFNNTLNHIVIKMHENHINSSRKLIQMNIWRTRKFQTTHVWRYHSQILYAFLNLSLEIYAPCVRSY